MECEPSAPAPPQPLRTPAQLVEAGCWEDAGGSSCFFLHLWAWLSVGPVISLFKESPYYLSCTEKPPGLSWVSLKCPAQDGCPGCSGAPAAWLARSVLACLLSRTPLRQLPEVFLQVPRGPHWAGPSAPSPRLSRLWRESLWLSIAPQLPAVALLPSVDHAPV